jgi:hypothetical protein
MTDFFIDDNFYNELIDFIEYEGLDLEEVQDFEDDWFIEANDSREEKVINFSAQWITERIDEGRFPEDDEDYFDRVYKIFENNIDFDKINALLPTVIFPSRKTFKITKVDLIEALS